MNSKLFLFIILIIVLISSFSLQVVEGVCNFKDTRKLRTGILGERGAPISGRTEDECDESGIYSNNQRIKDANAKLNELKYIQKNTIGKNIAKNNSGITENKRIILGMKDALPPDGEEEQDDEEVKAAEAESSAKACEKYPVSC